MVAGNVNPAGSDPIRSTQSQNIGRTNVPGDNRTQSPPSVDGLGGTVQEPPVVPTPPPLTETVSAPPPSSNDRGQRATAREGIISSFNLGEAATSFLTDAVNRRHPL